MTSILLSGINTPHGLGDIINTIKNLQQTALS